MNKNNIHHKLSHFQLKINIIIMNIRFKNVNQLLSPINRCKSHKKGLPWSSWLPYVRHTFCCLMNYYEIVCIWVQGHAKHNKVIENIPTCMATRAENLTSPSSLSFSEALLLRLLDTNFVVSPALCLADNPSSKWTYSKLI